ncbi:hypothetical protein Tco_0751403 [Tanacetum coccineum]|uniref:Uncharacterized protein n=1 Tax=Tanacetum coccineum TaxID=301880 RepID=A0ABQ4Z6U1_9ASTR
MIEKDVRLNNPNVIAPGMFKLDLEPLAPRVLNNRDAHIDYIKHSREHADTLREIERITKKRTKNKAKTTKLDSEWKSCEGQSQSKAKDQKSQSQLNKLTVKTGAVIEEYYWLQSHPSMGRKSPKVYIDEDWEDQMGPQSIQQPSCCN